MGTMAKLLAMLRSIAVLAVFTLTLAGGNAYAVPLTVGNSVTTNNGIVYTLDSCSNSTTCNDGTMSLTANGEGLVVTGTAGGAGVFESITTGSVDTFMIFEVQSPIQSTAVGITATGCGDNPLVTGCSATNNQAYATATLYANTSEAFNGTSLGPASGIPVGFSSLNPGATQINATDEFTPAETTFYVKVDLNAIVGSGTSYVAFDSVTLDVPEPTSWAVFTIGLVGVGVLRRRRRQA